MPESLWLAEVADVIADDRPSATLVVNGGEITCDDVARSVARRRPVLVLAGTGRTIDAIAAAVAGHGDEPARGTDRRVTVDPHPGGDCRHTHGRYRYCPHTRRLKLCDQD